MNTKNKQERRGLDSKGVAEAGRRCLLVADEMAVKFILYLMCAKIVN